jgi:hypothetical protein
MTWKPVFERWRDGGWYVANIRYPSGACGCVSNNYTDKKWRIACLDRHDLVFSTRHDAATAEMLFVGTLHAAKEPTGPVCTIAGLRQALADMQAFVETITEEPHT